MSKLALKIQRYCKSLLLLELLKGLALTGRHLFRKKITVFYPEEKTPQSVRRRTRWKHREKNRIKHSMRHWN
jgi:formate hydrogenlyase subunit 6/NADH:ubiquinone oxidoreductase subunit I